MCTLCAYSEYVKVWKKTITVYMDLNNMSQCVYVYVGVCMYVRLCERESARMCVHVWVCVCMCVCVCVSVKKQIVYMGLNKQGRIISRWYLLIIRILKNCE